MLARIRLIFLVFKNFIVYICLCIALHDNDFGIIVVSAMHWSSLPCQQCCLLLFLLIFVMIKSKSILVRGCCVFVQLTYLSVLFVLQTKRRSYVECFHLPMRRNPQRNCRPASPQQSCSSSPSSSRSSPPPDNVSTFSLS